MDQIGTILFEVKIFDLILKLREPYPTQNQFALLRQQNAKNATICILLNTGNRVCMTVYILIPEQSTTV